MSPDGKFVAYVARDPSRTLREVGSAGSGSAPYPLLPTGAPLLPGAEVWVEPLDGVARAAVSVNGGKGNSWAPTWAPSGHRLAFLSDHENEAALWIWDPRRHPALRRVTPARLSTWYYGSLTWTSDGRSIVIVSPPANVLAQLRARRPSYPRVPPVPDALTVQVRRAGFRDADQQGAKAKSDRLILPIFGDPGELYVVGVATGKVRRLAVDRSMDWAAPSPDGRFVAYLAMRDYGRPGGQRYQAYYDLLLVPMMGGVSRVIARDLPLYVRGAAVLRWSPDSRMIAYRTAGLESQRGLFVVKIDSWAPIPVAHALLLDLGRPAGPVWDPSSKAFYGWSGPTLWRFDAVSGRGAEVAQLSGKTVLTVLSSSSRSYAWSSDSGRSVIVVAVDDSTRNSEFYRVHLNSGRTDKLYEAAEQIGSYGGWGAEYRTSVSLENERIAFTAESAGEPEEILVADTGFTAVRRVSALGASVAGVPMGRRELVRWRTDEGESRQGLVLLPPDYKPGTRYPLIVWMYESSLRDANTFGLSGQQFFNLQLFATRGYVCFFPNLYWPREVVMHGLAEQVRSGIRELAHLGIADSMRVGVVGHSSGGYDVLAMVVTTPWLRAAVASAGVADMASMFGSTIDYPVGYDWVESQMGLGGPPWQYPERYVANSPSYHFDQVQTPLLLLQGTADEVNTRQMDLAFAELRRLSKVVEYRRYVGEGHVPDDWTPANRTDAMRRMLEWWEQYLRPTK